MAFLQRVNKSYATRLQKATLNITTTELTTVGVSQALAFAAALPSDAFVVGAKIDITTAMSGGGAASCVVDVGIQGGDTDGFIDGANVFTGASTPISHPRGVQIPSQAASITPVATVTADVNVSTLTAGDITVTVYYHRTGQV